MDSVHNCCRYKGREGGNCVDHIDLYIKQKSRVGGGMCVVQIVLSAM